MALGRKPIKEEETQDKSIDINAQMHGTLTFRDPVNLRINGDFTGELDTRGTLTIGNKANVEARINGDNIVVAGKVTGNIIANRMLVLMPTAVLIGNISTAKLNIVEGAIFQGECRMTAEDLLSIHELSEYLEIDLGEIEELANSGKIPATRSGSSWKFERAKIDTWAASGKVK